MVYGWWTWRCYSLADIIYKYIDIFNFYFKVTRARCARASRSSGRHGVELEVCSLLVCTHMCHGFMTFWVCDSVLYSRHTLRPKTQCCVYTQWAPYTVYSKVVQVLIPADVVASVVMMVAVVLDVVVRESGIGFCVYFYIYLTLGSDSRIVVG